MRKVQLYFGRAAINVLGMRQYIKYLVETIRCAPRVMKLRSLSPVDQRMSGIIRVSYAGRRFQIDCGYVDRALSEGSYTFGLIRELYIKNCYLAHHALNLSALRTVVDLGANRGLFSIMMAQFARRVMYVEPQEQYHEVFLHNMRLNHLDNSVVCNAAVGTGGVLQGFSAKWLSLDELLSQNGWRYVDFLKADIEGSEFGLISETSCLSRIGAIAMEVHPAYGDPARIVSRLKECGHEVLASDDGLLPTTNPKRMMYIYSKNRRDLE